jgi:N-carbamoylputrescine amidase
MKDCTLALIQMACKENKEKNIQKAASMIEQAAHTAEVICLQELFYYTYFPQEMDHRYFDLAEPARGETTEFFQQVAEEYGIVLIVPLFERVMEGLWYNTAVVIDEQGTILGTYRKNHIPHEPYYYEKYYFKPGDLGFPVFETSHVTIGIGICWDQWFPETGRLLALNGAELILFPSAIGRSHHGSPQWTAERMRDEWILVNRAQASMNKVYVGALNRVGKEKEMVFFGNSIICNPVGEILEEGSEKEEIITAHIQTSLLAETRVLWPFFRDRREETYGNLVDTYKGSGGKA